MYAEVVFMGQSDLYRVQLALSLGELGKTPPPPLSLQALPQSSLGPRLSTRAQTAVIDVLEEPLVTP